MTPIGIVADLHVHTLASPCAYSTLAEMVEAAVQRGLKALAITDHGPGLQGGLDRFQFQFPTVLPKEHRGVQLYHGVEANILDAGGDLDLHGSELAALDLVVAGLHPGTAYRGSSTEEHTRAVVAAMENPAVRIISHPHNMHFPVQMEEVVPAAVRTGTWLELNHRYMGGSGNPEALTQSRTMLRLAAEQGARICVNSDSHFMAGVGQVANALALLDEVGFPAELVVNSGTLELDAAIRTPKHFLDPEVEERLVFLTENDLLDPDFLPVLHRGVDLVQAGIGKVLTGENAVMFVTHLASTVNRLCGKEPEFAELDPLVAAEIKGQAPSLFYLVDHLIALLDEQCPVQVTEVERLLFVAHVAVLAS